MVALGSHAYEALFLYSPTLFSGKNQRMQWKQPTQTTDPRCKSPLFTHIYMKPNHLTCIDILDRTCHFFLCSACVYCAVAVWWGAAEGGEHLHGRAEPVWGTVEVHSEPWEGDQELIEAHHVSSYQPDDDYRLKKSKISRVAVLRVISGPCLHHPACPTWSSPKGILPPWWRYTSAALI